MLQKETLQFLKDLKKNNNKPWFDDNRKVYEQAKKDFEALAQNFITSVATFDSSIAHLQPKDCLFRINRDVRFSKDKSPYKTNFGLSISKGGKKGVAAGYYLHVEPGESFIGGGMWMPMAPELKKVRQEIDYNWQEFQQMVTSKTFTSVYGDLDKSSEYTLSRPPKGYEEDNPAIEYLKLKSFVALAPLPDKAFLQSSFVADSTPSFLALHPLLQFLNRALED